MPQYESADRRKDDSLMEPIYRKVDRQFQLFSILATLIGVVIGFINGFREWAVIPMALWLILMFVAQKIPNRTWSLGLSGLFFVTYVAWYMAFTHGLVETRLLYFAFLPLLLLYRSRVPLIAAAIIATLFIAAMAITSLTPEWVLGDFVLDYVLEPMGLTATKLSYTYFALSLSIIISIWMSDNLQRDTYETLELDVAQLRQIDILEENQRFAEQMADGNLESREQIEEDDNLGEALEKMRKNLEEARIREEEERYINKGLNEAAEILRRQEEGLEALCDEVLQFLVDYLKGNQGAIFLLEEGDKGRYLDMYACYAYDRKKYHRQQVRPGQGLTGQVFLEGKTSYLKKIPANYIQIKSGLGGSNPRNLILIPMRTSEEVKGVLELASFHEFHPYQITFLERVANNMASTFEVVRINDKTRELLAATQSTAEELQSQEEEMRQNMEELEATQEEMRRKERSFQKQMDDLKANHTIELINLKKELAEARDQLHQSERQGTEE
ncbi:MAG: GAF domain-containing protein [Bacteroidota bacterium]